MPRAYALYPLFRSCIFCHFPGSAGFVKHPIAAVLPIIGKRVAIKGGYGFA
jgi:hypothetical protein